MNKTQIKDIQTMKKDELLSLIATLLDEREANAHPVRRQTDKWLTDGNVVYSSADAFFRKGVKFAVGKAAEEAGATRLTNKSGREKYTSDDMGGQYVVAFKFKSKKAAEKFADAENNWTPDNK